MSINKSREKFKNKTHISFLLLLVPLAIYFSFGFHHISQFETADEHFWIYDAYEGRIHDYWRAVSYGDLLSTRINDKPGITLALVSGIGTILQRNPSERIVVNDQYLRDYIPEITENINFVFRFPQLIFIGFFIFFFYWIIYKLTDNKWLALFASTLIYLNPVILGISQIINPDALLWVFANSSLLSFLAYLKEEKRKFAVLSSIFLGLALLSKYAAMILVPFFALVIAIHFLFNFEKWKEEGDIPRKVIRYISAYFLILIGAALTFSLFMPAVFAYPRYLWEGTVGFKKTSPLWVFGTFLIFNALLLFDAQICKSRFLKKFLSKLSILKIYLPKLVFSILFAIFALTLVNYSFGDNFLGIKGINFDAGRSYPFRRQDFIDQLFLEFYPLIFSLTPLVLMSLIFFWAKSVFREGAFKTTAFFLSLFLVIFYAAILQQQLLVNIRYSILIYPMLMVIAACGIFEFFKLDRWKSKNKMLAWGGIIVFSVVSLWLIKPFYFNYTNEFLSKNRIITGAWGYGGYEAAAYLNSLPGAKNMVIWSDYWGVCPFFKGYCIKMSEIRQAKLINRDIKIDYYVTSRRGSISSETVWKSLGETLGENNKPVWELNIDGRPKNYVQIYKPEYNYFDLINNSDSEEDDPEK